MPESVLHILYMEIATACKRDSSSEVLIEGQVIRVLEPGDSFGEVTPSILCTSRMFWNVRALPPFYLSQIWLGAEAV